MDDRNELGDAIDEGFAANEADVRMGAGPRRQMLTAAEADLEP
jgi:hypothetical protein